MAKSPAARLCGFSWLFFFMALYNSSSQDACSSNPCPTSSSCLFIENRYYCCKNESVSPIREKEFTDSKAECKSDSEINHPACINLSKSDPFLQKCEKQLKGMNSQDNRDICTQLSRLSHSCGERNATLSLKEIGDSSPVLQNFTFQLTRRKQDDRATLVTLYLQSVEKAVLTAASRDMKGGQQSVEGQFMAIETLKIEEKLTCKPKNQTFVLKAGNQMMGIHCTTIEKNDLGGIIAFIAYTDIGSIINETFVSEENLTTEEKLHTFYLNSKIVSGAMRTKKNGSLTQPVNFTFQHKQVKKNNEKPLCVYWQGLSWSNEGCQVISSDENHTVCSCGHLSSFAVLMASTELKEDLLLATISTTGLSLSLLCLFLAALTFLLCRPIQNISALLHLQLSICLFLAHLLFLVGIDQTEPKVLCSIIAGVLHYLYLASFTWMLLEGLYLFLTIRNLKVANYTRGGRFKKFMYSFGYGLPAVIVAVSAGVGPSNYGTSTHCWLNLHRGFIWSFTGPVIVIILINISFYLTTLCILRDQLSSLNTEVSRIQNTRILTFKAIAQLTILGGSWILGVFLFGAIKEPARSAIAYSFTIVNVLQGVYIFLVHCLLNHKVREEYKNWFKKLRKRTKLDSYDLFSFTSHTKMMEKTVDFPEKIADVSSGK